MIIAEWEAYASRLTPAANSVSPRQLRDHIAQMLEFLVKDMNSPQTLSEGWLKSLGLSEASPGSSASESHAALRMAGGFNIKQMVSEFRALRASIVRLWERTNPCTYPDTAGVIRFNEAIDQIMSETVSYYTSVVQRTQDLFVGVVGHDLRNPLHSITGCVDLLRRAGPLNERQSMLCDLAGESTGRMTAMLDDLADLTRARLSVGLSIITAPMDAAFVVQQVAQETRAGHPASTIEVDVSGEAAVEWDKARFGQVVSNLLGNAVQYSFPGTRISLALDATSDVAVTLCVHNYGAPIPSEKLATLFDALTRGRPEWSQSAQGVNLGLGLFIANDIVTAHGGTLRVTSTEESGTTFTAALPRHVTTVAPQISIE